MRTGGHADSGDGGDEQLSAGRLWDYERWAVLCTRVVHRARDAGALSVLPRPSSLVGVHHYAAQLTAAAFLIEEVATVTEAAGSHLAPYGALLSAPGRAGRPRALS
jgi:hypothetical protein